MLVGEDVGLVGEDVYGAGEMGRLCSVDWCECLICLGGCWVGWKKC